jgi:hypothetical protein
MHIGVDGLAVEDQDVLLKESLAISPGELVPPCITDIYCGGIHAISVLHTAQNTSEIDLLRPSLAQGPDGQGRYELFP